MYKMNFRIIQVLLWILTYLAIFFYCFYKFENLGLTVAYSLIVTFIYGRDFFIRCAGKR